MSVGMYSTREFNPKVAESYLSIGDPYEKTTGTDPRTKGKQFQTNPSKTGQLQGYFEEFKYSTDNYQDTNAYRITQPKSMRKTGFGTGDANKRDEFTLDIRAQQYKELLSKELTFQAKKAEKEKLKLKQTESNNNNDSYDNNDSLDDFTHSTQFNSNLFQTQVPSLLYDIGRTHITPICNKCNRDTFYCKHRINSSGSSSLRRNGPLKTMAEQIGAEIRQHNIKPPHGKRSTLKDFYDNNHLAVGKYE